MRAQSFTRCIVSLTLLILTALGMQARAATPTLINYQGLLNTSGGSPAPNGNYSVVFTIYDAVSGGTSRWTETQSVTTVGGSFSVQLGTINPISDTVFNATTRYLGVKVGTDPELTPRMTLVSVPYAMRVATVDGSTGGRVSGNIRLDSSAATSGNIYKNGVLFLHDFGAANTFLGENAGNLTMTGESNTASGFQALSSNTTGNENTASGSDALTSNTTGYSNTASGFWALRLNTTGSENTANGTQALAYNTTGFGNTASGYEALLLNTTGNGNTACGFEALLLNTTGHENTATGIGALENNTTGNENTASGGGALFNNITGDSNTAMGVSALGVNTSGSKNTAGGVGALKWNTTGDNNTASGYNALDSNTVGEWNTASGVNALKFNSTGNRNTASGVNALRSNTGDYNTADGVYALITNVTGNFNTALGYNADVSAINLTNATAIGSGALVNASNKIRLGNSSVMVIEGQVAYTFTSDRNQKENFHPIDGEDVLRKIGGFNLTSWNYKKNDPATFRHYGPMAQDFFAAFGHDGVGQCGDSVTMNSGDEAGILFSAVQALEKRTADFTQVKAERDQLSAKVASIAVQNTEIQSENRNLRAELDELKKMVSQLAAQSKQSGTAKYSVK